MNHIFSKKEFFSGSFQLNLELFILTLQGIDFINYY